MSWAAAAISKIASPYFVTRSSSGPRFRAVAATWTPRSRAAIAHSRPKPRDVPVMLILPGPGYDGEGDDLVSKTLTTAHRLLEPIRGH